MTIPSSAVFNGATVFSAAPLVDGGAVSGFTVNGLTDVSITPVGALVSPSFVAAGATAVNLALTGLAVLPPLSVIAGSTRLIFRFTPDMSDNEPIAVGVELTGNYVVADEDGT